MKGKSAESGVGETHLGCQKKKPLKHQWLKLQVWSAYFLVECY